MKKTIFLFILIYVCQSSGNAQKDILYEVDSSVKDSLQKGIEKYETFLNKPFKDLQMFVLISEKDGEFEFYLQEYSHLPESGLLNLIRFTNRKLRLSEITKLPVLTSADNLSLLLKGDGISGIPLSGYYIKVIRENGKQKVIETSFLY